VDGLLPDPAGGAYSPPPDLLAGFEGATSNGEQRGRECERGGRKRVTWGKKRKGSMEFPNSAILLGPLISYRYSSCCCFCWGDLFQIAYRLGLRLRGFKSDRDEIWQDWCSSSKIIHIDWRITDRPMTSSIYRLVLLVYDARCLFRCRKWRRHDLNLTIFLA